MFYSPQYMDQPDYLDLQVAKRLLIGHAKPLGVRDLKDLEGRKLYKFCLKPVHTLRKIHRIAQHLHQNPEALDAMMQNKNPRMRASAVYRHHNPPIWLLEKAMLDPAWLVRAAPFLNPRTCRFWLWDAMTRWPLYRKAMTSAWLKRACKRLQKPKYEYQQLARVYLRVGIDRVTCPSLALKLEKLRHRDPPTANGVLTVIGSLQYRIFWVENSAYKGHNRAVYEFKDIGYWVHFVYLQAGADL